MRYNERNNRTLDRTMIDRQNEINNRQIDRTRDETIEQDKLQIDR